MEALCKMFTDMADLKTLDISSLNLNKRACKEIVKAFNESCDINWNLNNNLRELIWNEDLRCSPSTALKFTCKDLPNIYNLKLQKLRLQGVFRTLENRQKVRDALDTMFVECVLDGSWNPEVTEEVSNKEYVSDKE